MKNILFLLFSLLVTSVFAQDATDIMQKVDANMASEARIVESKMTIHGRRNSRTVESRSYTEGNKNSMTEYLAPDRDKGTKMLKIEDRLWIYSPDTDRTVQLSGHMLRQSVMGSDLSYEDMMEDRELLDIYDAEIVGEEEIDGRNYWVIQLDAKVEDVNYVKRKTWIDQERYIPIKEEMYAKSGQLLKSTTLSNVKKIDGRWFPTKTIYKDELKNGSGTEFKIVNIKFNEKIPDYIFTKAVLKK
ncbi:outer membrane lipoprotein-sorting protein [Portibacter lacus]|uniref:Outer membrane lipoprotein-sorting protein n=1 Tax=Portibacter lacus TaxID=1099794 RepID=A0AA37SSA9_9BACT|nr:outer membrane lipoprotein-sorting protein [Portibacter lacus]GLR19478.1 outer membrane lipoprotein-sorting protein [Portibacter lacus]